jgi:16S rRNA (guanine966-N2)-methyltransferase
VLDLYAGSGALGLEALSRGATHATFIDESQACLTAISQTLDGMKMRDAATLVRGSLPAALERFERTADIAFLDPPYEDQSALQTLGRVGRHLHPEGTVVYEHASRYNPPERPAGLILRQRRVYGDSAIALYALQEGE